jgi:hypothetical protein
METDEMHVQAARWRALAKRCDDRTAAALREAADTIEARAGEIERAQQEPGVSAAP